MPLLRRRGLPAPSVVCGVHVARRRGAPPRTSRDAVDVDLQCFAPNLRRMPGTAGGLRALRRRLRRAPGRGPGRGAADGGRPRPTAIGMPMELVLVPAPGDGGAVTFAFRPAEDGNEPNDGVAVVGVGIHPFGRHPGVSGLEMAAVAARAALTDAGSAGRRWTSPRADRTRRATPTRRCRSSVSPECRSSTSATAARPEGPRCTAHAMLSAGCGGRAGGRLRQAPARRVQPAARGLGPRLLVRRDRPDAHHAVLRAEDPALHGRARDQRTDAGQGRVEGLRQRRRNPTRGAAGRSWRRTCSPPRWSTTRSRRHVLLAGRRAPWRSCSFEAGARRPPSGTPTTSISRSVAGSDAALFFEVYDNDATRRHLARRGVEVRDVGSAARRRSRGRANA